MRDRYVPAASVAGAVAVIFVLTAAGSLLANRTAEWVTHGLGHLIVAGPIAALGVFASRVWPKPKSVAPARASRRTVIVGFTGVAMGQVLEVLGARVDEPAATSVEQWAHTAGQIVTVLSMLVLLLGGALAGIAAARAGTAPRWAVAVALALGGALLMFMIFGSPDPNA